MRIPVFAANWKMHKTVQETTSFVREFSALVKSLTQVELILAPPFTAIAAAAEIARNTREDIAAQDLYFEREGAFTGEVSAIMIRDAGASHVIVGHSERRRLRASDRLHVGKLRRRHLLRRPLLPAGAVV